MQQTYAAVAMPPITDSILQTAIIYEANIRQYSAEGTFEAFTKDIPQLRELGVKIIWLMPVYPISSKNRKAYGNLMAHDIEDPEERKKFLGSYYAIADYKGINPEFGTLEDFRALVQTAHENGMYVILDWVANHTGWDHHWIEEHPEFYTKNEQGEVSEPLKDDGRTPEGWSDVADLNFDNQELRETMISEMLYWLKEENIDGFRCDVASFVPVDFWQQAIAKLRAEKDIYMLAESDDPALLQPGLFDTAYGWASHHLLNDIAAGKNNASGWNAHMDAQLNKFGARGLLMNFVDNHDENSWNGTFFSRAQDYWEPMLALSYAAPGLPLIYSGLEYDLNHSLKFFEKDSIPKEKGKVWPVLKKLGAAKQDIPALHGGKNSAAFELVATSQPDQIIAFKRTKEATEILYLANFSNYPAQFTVQAQGNYKDLISQELLALRTSDNLNLAPGSYYLLVKS